MDINISERFLFPNFPATKPMVAFNWKDCLDNIALGGLQDCTFFQNEIGTFFPDGEIKTIVNTVKMNNYNQYKNLCTSTPLPHKSFRVVSEVKVKVSIFMIKSKR